MRHSGIAAGARSDGTRPSPAPAPSTGERSEPVTSDQFELSVNHVISGRRPSAWVTRARPKIDRIACPWAILRFIDPAARFFYVPTESVFEIAARENAVAFDVPGAPISHAGDRCSFDVLIAKFKLDDPALHALAPIIRGADTDRHELAPEAAGLHALSLGLSRLFDDDHQLLDHGLLIYDALYAWASKARGERHDWRPEARS